MLTARLLLCLLALCLVLAEARYHGRRSDRDDDVDDDYPSLAEQREPRQRHRTTRGHSDEDLRELRRLQDAEDDYDEELRPRSPRHRLHARRHSLGWGQRRLELEEEDAADRSASSPPRGKRHNRRRAWTEQNKKSFNRSRSRLHLESDGVYEVEVREAQNSSLCNYTVTPIPDPGDRLPRDLEHVRCNHVGSRCQDKGTYCCIQTYRNVEVVYTSSGTKEMMKVYSGCVCSLVIYGTLNPYTPDLDLND